MIAVDQIDPIISEASREKRQTNAALGAEQIETQSIIEKLVEGLMGLHEVKQRAITMISSLDASWEVLKSRSSVAVDARYRAPTPLKTLSRAELARMLVAARLMPVYASVGFSPPYETWPFAPEAFESAIGFTPRIDAPERHGPSKSRCSADCLHAWSTCWISEEEVARDRKGAPKKMIGTPDAHRLGLPRPRKTRPRHEVRC